MTAALVPGRETGSLALVPALERAASPLLAYLASLGSAASRRTQCSALHQVARWAGAADAWAFPWESWTHAKQAGLRGYLAARAAPSYGNRVLGAVRGVAEACWLAEPSLMSGDTLARIRAVDGLTGRRLPPGRALTPQELARIFDAAAWATAAGARDTALLALLAGGGLRIHEACGLELADYDAPRSRVRVMGKGQRERMVDLPPGAVADLGPWLVVRGLGPGPLLWHVTPQDEPRPLRLHPRGATRVVERLGAAAGVELSTHDFRRTVVSNLLALGEDLPKIGRTVGHSKVTTTAGYDRRPQEACADMMRRYSYRGAP